MVLPFDLQVSKLAYGCAGLSGYYSGPLPYEEGCSMIKEVFNRGITFFDTADVYGENHHNEILVGKVVHFVSRLSFDAYQNSFFLIINKQSQKIRRKSR